MELYAIYKPDNVMKVDYLLEKQQPKIATKGKRPMDFLRFQGHALPQKREGDMVKSRLFLSETVILFGTGWT